MPTWVKISLGLAVAISIFSAWFMIFRGDGGFTRMTSLTGIYAVCKPKGYPAVCFGDTAGTNGGVSCIPYDGECK